MRKAMLTLLMVLFGVIGLLATACGVFFFAVGAGDSAITYVLFGFLPGALFLFGAWALFNALRSSGKAAAPPVPPP